MTMRAQETSRANAHPDGPQTPAPDGRAAGDRPDTHHGDAAVPPGETLNDAQDIAKDAPQGNARNIPQEAEHPLRVSGLCVRRGGKMILHDLAFSLSAGEVLGVIGANGAGKSTLLMTLCGQIKPDAGSIRHARRRVDGACAMAIGYAPQRSALYDRLTALENVAVFARLAGLPRAAIRDHAMAMLKTVGAEDIAHALTGALSGGQRQRINIACALVGGPAAVALDEPASSLDPAMTRALGDLIAAIAADGQAMMLVTHDMAEAERICHRVMVLDKGRIAAIDTPRALIARHTDGRIALALEFAAPLSAAAMTGLTQAGFRSDASGLWQAEAASSARAFRLIEEIEAEPGMAPIAHVSLSRPGLSGVLATLAAGQHSEGASCA